MFCGYEKCIWKSFQKPWRLSWKKLSLGALKSNQFPRLSPLAAKSLLNLQSGTRSCQCWQWGLVQDTMTEFFLDQILVLVLKQMLQASKADCGSTLRMFSPPTPALLTSKDLDEAVTLQEYLQLYLIRWEASLKSNIIPMFILFQ